MRHPFQHCSECGKPGLLARSEREFVCSACGFRHFITPIPAACALLLDDEGRLLVTRRAHEPGMGRLGLPGGVVEGGETAEEACSREVLEEVGLKVPALEFKYLMSLPNQYLFQGFIWPTLDLFFVGRVSAFDAVHLADGEVSEWQALALAEVSLGDFAFPSNAEAVRQMRLIFPCIEVVDSWMREKPQRLNR